MSMPAFWQACLMIAWVFWRGLLVEVWNTHLSLAVAFGADAVGATHPTGRVEDGVGLVDVEARTWCSWSGNARDC